MLLFLWEDMVQATRIRLGNEPAIYTFTHRPISRAINGGDKWEDLFLAFRV